MNRTSHIQSTRKIHAHGFTLIEVLIVISIIAILATITLIAVNPTKNFREASNVQRSANVSAIINAVGQYIIDNKGDVSGLSLPTTATDIGGGTGDIDLCDLVPDYIPALPTDPTLSDQSITESECASAYETGYQISINGSRITISAPQTVDVETGAPASEPVSVMR